MMVLLVFRRLTTIYLKSLHAGFITRSCEANSPLKLNETFNVETICKDDALGVQNSKMTFMF